MSLEARAKTSTATKASDLEREHVGELPVIMRPAEAVIVESGCVKKGGNYICASREELDEVADTWGESCKLLVQPYLQGTGEGIFGFVVFLSETKMKI